VSLSRSLNLMMASLLFFSEATSNSTPGLIAVHGTHLTAYVQVGKRYCCLSVSRLNGGPQLLWCGRVLFFPRFDPPLRGRPGEWRPINPSVGSCRLQTMPYQGRIEPDYRDDSSMSSTAAISLNWTK